MDGEAEVTEEADMATLGNLCVDIVLSVQSLPTLNTEAQRQAYVQQLAAYPHDKRFWEAGGNCNLAIAAARLGLRVLAVAHTGDEIYGRFLHDVLQNEGVAVVGISEKLYETPLCWVVVDRFQNHEFFSLADFSDEEPERGRATRLTEPVRSAIRRSKILFCDGYAFDEFCPDLLERALRCAIGHGTAVLFDPGPRGRTLARGTPEKRMTLELFLRLSDVVVLTSDEAESLTGIGDPILSGRKLIGGGARAKWVVVKLGSRGSVLITRSGISCAPAFKVNVVDTVGCGDSYAAAIAFGYLHGMPEIDTLTLANAVGAATATGVGGGRNVASLDGVLGLLRRPSLGEDDEFWNELFGENSEDQQGALLLSERLVGGHDDRFVRVHVQSVVSGLLPRLEKKRCVGVRKLRS